MLGCVLDQLNCESDTQLNITSEESLNEYVRFTSRFIERVCEKYEGSRSEPGDLFMSYK